MAPVVARACRSVALLLLAVVLSGAVSVTGAGGSKSFNISNNCNYTVWPGISSGSGVGFGSVALDTTGFDLAPGESRAMAVPSGWSGRVWGRTLCSFTDSGGNKFSCVTGDCGSGRQDCVGGNAAPPVTLAQFTMDGGSGGMDSYDVSLVDGFNVPMMVVPYQQQQAGQGNCAATGCVVDLNGACPPELRVTSSAGAGAVACRSACQAFGSPQYCCTGEYGSPDTCKPSAYSELFKKACPRAFSYAYDGAGTSFTCGGGGGGDTTYAISFCPTTTSGKRSTSPASLSQPPVTGNLPHTDGSQVGAPTSSASPRWIIIIVSVTGVLSFVAAVWGMVKLVNECCYRQGAGE